MSIDFLFELERSLERGATIYACPGAQPGRWDLANSLEALRKVAKRAAAAKRSAITIMRLMPRHAALPETPLLIATKIGGEETRGAANISWSTVDTADAAETLRDVSQGPSPFFALETEEVVQPA